MKRTALKRKTPLKSKRKAPAKKKSPKRSARKIKMDRKRKLCEDYDLPIIQCRRWGTGKNPTRTELLRGMAWTVFSQYIRDRDMGKPCISCDIILELGAIQAGHYVPVGGSSIAMHFREDNVHGECPTCNADFHGWHLVPMRKNMVHIYGEDHVQRLDEEALRKSNFKPVEQYYVDIIRRYI